MGKSLNLNLLPASLAVHLVVACKIVDSLPPVALLTDQMDLHRLCHLDLEMHPIALLDQSRAVDLQGMWAGESTKTNLFHY